MTKLEKQVAGILAKEFVRTGVIDCPRLARLVCKAIAPKSVKHAADVQQKKGKQNE